MKVSGVNARSLTSMSEMKIGLLDNELANSP